jgi:hypothetical protein
LPISREGEGRLEVIFEVILQFLFELVLQFVVEMLFELGLHALAEPFQRKPNPLVAALGYVLIGCVLGALTLLVFPTYMVRIPILRWVNLVLTPVLVGIAMVLVGMWRQQHDQLVLRINRFSYGFLFAFSVALVRFVWAG